MERYTQRYRKIWKTDALVKKLIKPCEDESKAVRIYCNTQIAAKHYDLVRHSETKKHKKASKPLNSINIINLPICFTHAVVPVLK